MPRPLAHMFYFVLGIWVLFFAITRVHMLQATVARMSVEVKNEEWLLEQCQLHEFYHNMKHHSSLCDEVSAKARDALWLHATREVIENSYLCGFESCAVLVENATLFIARQSFYALSCAALFVIFTPTLLLPVWRRCVNSMAEDRMHKLYNCPYGQPHYFLTHRDEFSAGDSHASKVIY